MAFTLRIFVTLLCIVFIVMVCLQVSKGKLLLKYSLLWILMAILALFVSVAPQIAFCFAGLLGFDTMSNFIFFVAALFLMAVCVSLSAALSKCVVQIKTLTQELALRDADQRYCNEDTSSDSTDAQFARSDRE